MMSFLIFWWYCYDDWLAGAVGAPWVGEIPLILWLGALCLFGFIEKLLWLGICALAGVKITEEDLE